MRYQNGDISEISACLFAINNNNNNNNNKHGNIYFDNIIYSVPYDTDKSFDLSSSEVNENSVYSILTRDVIRIWPRLTVYCIVRCRPPKT